MLKTAIMGSADRAPCEGRDRRDHGVRRHAQQTRCFNKFRSRYLGSAWFASTVPLNAEHTPPELERIRLSPLGPSPSRILECCWRLTPVSHSLVLVRPLNLAIVPNQEGSWSFCLAYFRLVAQLDALASCPNAN